MLGSDRPPEFWAGLIAATMFVFNKSEGRRLMKRTTEAGVSGGIGYAAAPWVAERAGGSETIAVIVVTSVGYLLLEVITSIVADRAFIKDLIKQRLGGKSQ